MKRKIAYFLVKLAAWFSPETDKILVQHIKYYKALHIGTAWPITKKDIEHCKAEHGIKSTGEAKQRVIGDILAEQRKALLKEAASHIDTKTWNRHGQTIVESRLNVYVRKETPCHRGSLKPQRLKPTSAVSVLIAPPFTTITR